MLKSKLVISLFFCTCIVPFYSFEQSKAEVFTIEKGRLNGFNVDTVFDFKGIYDVFSIDSTSKLKSYTKTIKYRKAYYDGSTQYIHYEAYFFSDLGIWGRGAPFNSVILAYFLITEVDYTQRLLVLKNSKDTLVLGKTKYCDLKHLNLTKGYEISITQYFYKKHKKKYYYNYNDVVLLVFEKRKRQLVLTGFSCY